ncbi:MAG: hypothetical protein ABSH20_11455 [Tepidisphaeraceae bacterium]|jgi:hypothetical protein
MSKSKLASSVVFLSVCLIFPLIGWGAGSAGTTVTINATVDQFAEWGSAPYTIAAADWTGHITATNQSRTLTLSKTLTLYANANVTVTTTDGVNSGVLTNGTQTLTTEYKVTGGDLHVADVDADYISSAAFLAKSYHIDQVPGDGAYTMTLAVRMTSPNNRAPDAGNYQCVLNMTATW